MLPSDVLKYGYVYLHRYKVIAVIIIGFLMFQTHYLTDWYMDHYKDLVEWQNAPVIGLITGYVAALKFALEHILDQRSPPMPGEVPYQGVEHRNQELPK